MIKLKILLKEIDIVTLTKPDKVMYVLTYRRVNQKKYMGFVADSYLPEGEKYKIIHEIFIDKNIPFTYINDDMIFGFVNLEIAQKASQSLKEFNENYEFTPKRIDITKKQTPEQV